MGLNVGLIFYGFMHEMDATDEWWEHFQHQNEVRVVRERERRER